MSAVQSRDICFTIGAESCCHAQSRIDNTIVSLVAAPQQALQLLPLLLQLGQVRLGLGPHPLAIAPRCGSI